MKMYRYRSADRLSHKLQTTSYLTLTPIQGMYARKTFRMMREYGVPPRKAREAIWKLLFHCETKTKYTPANLILL